MQITVDMLNPSSVAEATKLFAGQAASSPAGDLAAAQRTIEGLRITQDALRRDLAAATMACQAAESRTPPDGAPMAPETAFAVGVCDCEASFLVSLPGVGAGLVRKLREWAMGYLGRGGAPAEPIKRKPKAAAAPAEEPAQAEEPAPTEEPAPVDDELDGWPGETAAAPQETPAQPTPTRSGPEESASGAATGSKAANHEDIRAATRAVLRAIPGGILKVREVMARYNAQAVDDIPADQCREVVDALMALMQPQPGGAK